MIRYYNSRELSKALGINLARWKRWTREFLPPDPLGGLQSGYARQYSMRETFLVALGGHLVGFQKYSVHQVKTILADLDSWLERRCYFQWNLRSDSSTTARVISPRHCIYIRSAEEGNLTSDRFFYAVTFSLSDGFPGIQAARKIDAEKMLEFINTPPEIQLAFDQSPYITLLCIGQFHQYFLDRLQRKPQTRTSKR